MSDFSYQRAQEMVNRVGREMTKNEFDKIDARTIANLTDKKLALWQAVYAPDSPQYIFAQNEWQRRLTAQQVRATRFAAWVGIVGVVVGTLLGWVISSLHH